MHELLGREGTSCLLMNLESDANRFPETDTYTMNDMLGDLKAGVFAELTNKKSISYWRRITQREYVRELIEYTILKVQIGNAGSGVSIDYSASDATTVVRAHLTQLKKEIDAAIPGMPDKMSRDHLLDLSLRIKRALDKKD